MGMATLCGARPRGFFIPYRFAAAADDATVYPAIEGLFESASGRFGDLLGRAESHAEAFGRIGVDAPPPQPRWGQDWFPRLDAAIAYVLVRERRPARIVEIGSGHSTRFLARAIADGGLATRLTAVDPAPRAGLDGLAVEWRRGLLQEVLAETGAASPLAALTAGDFLMIDSSHVLMPGSDVDLLLNRVLPLLPAGVLVHVHDVFLPDAYPRDWAWRGYNEQNALAPLLTSGAYAPLFASQFVATRMVDALARSCIARLPLVAGARESSLWLEKR